MDIDILHPKLPCSVTVATCNNCLVSCVESDSWAPYQRLHVSMETNTQNSYSLPYPVLSCFVPSDCQEPHYYLRVPRDFWDLYRPDLLQEGSRCGRDWVTASHQVRRSRQSTKRFNIQPACSRTSQSGSKRHRRLGVQCWLARFLQPELTKWDLGNTGSDLW